MFSWSFGPILFSILIPLWPGARRQYRRGRPRPGRPGAGPRDAVAGHRPPPDGKDRLRLPREVRRQAEPEEGVQVRAITRNNSLELVFFSADVKRRYGEGIAHIQFPVYLSENYRWAVYLWYLPN